MWNYWVDNFNKRMCKYLIQRYLGQYLQEKLSLDQLSVDLTSGRGMVTNVTLDCEALNALAEEQSIPIEFLEGSLESISLSIPWKTILQDSCEVEISGLYIAIQPKKRVETSTSMLDSMWTSMVSSIQLAKECLQTSDSEDEKEPAEENPSNSLPGLEDCAKAIDAVFSRGKVCFRNSVIRIERVQVGGTVGIALEVHIKLWNYADEACIEGSENEEYETAFSVKRINMEGVTCYSDLFPAEKYSNFQVPPEQGTNCSGEEASNLVMLAKLNGRHTISIKIKEDESIHAPQITIDCNFGSLLAFLSPIQAHILISLISDLLNPDPVNDKLPSKNLKQKPMDSFDFKRVERELQEQIKPGGIGLSGLQRQQGWSSPGLDDSDDEFLPLKSKSSEGGLFSSVHSTLMNASMTSVTSSVNESVDESVFSVPSSAKTTPLYYSSGSPKKTFGMQPSHIEKTNFSISLTSAVIVLLHEDIIILSSTHAAEAESVDRMKKYSNDFFKSLGMFSASSGKRNAQTMNNQLNAACNLNHSRLIAAPLKICGCITTSDSIPTTMGYVAFGYSELIEFLAEATINTNPTVVQILSFNDTLEQHPTESVRLDFKVKSYKNKTTRTSLKFHLQPCSSEVDISQFDRLNSLIYTKLPLYTKSVDLIEFGNDLSPQGPSLLMIKVTCESMTMNFRFPIPDLRAEGDLEKIPFWVRSIRNDSVVLNFKELKFTTHICSSQEILEFDTSCEEVTLSYKETQESLPVPFANAGRGYLEPDGVSISTQGLDKPRVLVTISPRRPADNQANQNLLEESDPVSFEAFMPQSPKTISPFTSKRVVHECHSSQEDLNGTNFESCIPGDRKEMGNFVSIAGKDVVYKIELQLHTVNVSFPSKHFFEEIYNRLSNDLLLWDPYIPKQFLSAVKSKIFHEFKPSSGFAEGSGSEDDEEEISAFYTPSISNNFRKSIGNKRANGQSEVTLNLVIRDGTLSFFTPFSNPTGGVVPGQKGQITFKILQGNLFLVSGFRGDPNLGYICIRSQEAEFYHTDLISNDSTDLPKFGDHVKKTIYPSDEGVLAKGYSNSSNTPEYLDMLSVAIKIDRDVIKRVKTFKVATSIKEGTLSHKVYLPNRSWFTQLLDFFDITDVPVLGYTPSSVVTELHLHLWDCAVDYQPISLAARSILSVGNFSLSCNIVAQTNTSVIRVMAEDTAFYLTTNLNSTILQHDYVCVLDMDLFELTLRLCQSRTSTAPKIELTTTNNVLHIRTCSDSFKLLMELLTYYANYGDLASESEISDEYSHSSPLRESPNEVALIDTEELWDKDKVMSTSNSEHVHDLVAEAMVDNDGIQTSPSAKSTPLSPVSRGNLELHFEDDEYSNMSNSKSESTNGYIPLNSKYYEPIMQSSNGLPVDISLSDDDEEAFCILENDPGVGIPSKSGEPKAKMLTDEPIRLIENHFSVPIGRTDILKAPKHYPNAIAKYSVQDVSIIWHLFGGDDFPLSQNKRSKEENLGDSGSGKVDPNFAYMYDQNEIDIGLDALNTGVVFSKTKAFESAWEAYESPKSGRKFAPDTVKNWRNKGGKGRKNDVCIELHLAKIKFQHEVYPENREQASRQVLVINTVEIRDRLTSSQFNKMLYLYSSPSRPRQSHANMVVIKAAHLRPDPHLNIEECCLKVSLLPLRVNVDQDALLFIYQFFSDISQKPETEDDIESGKTFSHAPSVESLPVMTVKNSEIDEEFENKEESDPVNLLIFDESPVQDDTVSTVSKDHSIDSTKSNMPVYFKQVIFSPDVPIRIDYMGKRLDMTHGPLAGILMCLGQLNCSEIQLKRLNYRNGILGVDKLVAYMVSEWGNDIKKNQLPSLLGGIGPLYSFVQIFQGVRDLFWLPIEQYQKDGRIAKGLQRGASAFSTSAAMAALELTNRLVQTIQGVAEFTYDMVSPGPSVQQQRRQSTRKKRHPQPNDIREGVTNAYNVVKDGLGDTAKTIVRVASKEHEQKGIPGAVGGVLRQLAPTVCVPIILSTQATSSLLDGFKSQLEPESRKEAAEKWKEN